MGTWISVDSLTSNYYMICAMLTYMEMTSVWEIHLESFMSNYLQNKHRLILCPRLHPWPRYRKINGIDRENVHNYIHEWCIKEAAASPFNHVGVLVESTGLYRQERNSHHGNLLQTTRFHLATSIINYNGGVLLMLLPTHRQQQSHTSTNCLDRGSGYIQSN